MELDPGGVLLDRVSRPIRAYLRERKDTARIVVASSLTAVNTKTGLCDSGESGISAEIAREMQHSTPLPNEYDDDLDWANMNWTPAPVDADPGKLFCNLSNHL